MNHEITKDALILVQQQMIQELRQKNKLFKIRSIYSCDRKCKPINDLRALGMTCVKCEIRICNYCPGWLESKSCQGCRNYWCNACASEITENLIPAPCSSCKEITYHFCQKCLQNNFNVCVDC